MNLKEQSEFQRQFLKRRVEATEGLPSDPSTSPGEADFKLLAENLPTLCWIARGDGYIVWYNSRWHEYCGTKPDDMEGWSWQSVHDPVQLPKVMERWTAAISSGSAFEMTFPLRGADGIFRPFLTRIVPINDKDGKIVRWFGVNTEITAQVFAETALQLSEAKFRVLTDAMPQMVWSTLPDGFHDYYNAQWYEFTGVPFGSTDGEAWNGMFHKDDQERAWKAWRHSLETGEPYEIEYRLRHHSGVYRWTLGRALPVRNKLGEIIRWIGTCTDIDESKKATERAELLSHELSHRIKNIFAVIAGLIRLSVRQAKSTGEFASQLGSRIEALGRAHEFARPHSADSSPKTSASTLNNLLIDLLQAYQTSDTSRIFVTGDDVEIDYTSATSLALLFHELATNAAKYGSLSSPAGVVAIHAAAHGADVQITWREQGGPKIASEPERFGFGSRLTSLSVEQQLSGQIKRHWDRDGLLVDISIPRSRLVRIS